jgi:hypothetical protein
VDDLDPTGGYGSTPPFQLGVQRLLVTHQDDMEFRVRGECLKGTLDLGPGGPVGTQCVQGDAHRLPSSVEGDLEDGLVAVVPAGRADPVGLLGITALGAGMFVAMASAL